MMRQIRYMTAITLLLCSVSATAACIGNPRWGGTLWVMVAGGQSIVADPSMKIGTVIAEGHLTMPAPGRQAIAFIPIARCPVNTIEQFSGTTALQSGNVFSTNVPGIGYQLFYPNGQVAPQYFPNPTNLYLLYYPQGDFAIKFIKTGPISPGVIPAGQYGYDRVASFSDFVVFQLLSPITVTVPTCQIKPGFKSQTVDFGSVASIDFSGIGTGAASRPFSIQLQCDAAVPAVGLTFEATPDPSGLPGTLRIDSGTGAATGVGIQVLGEDGKPINWKQRVALPITSGEARIDMSARYLQTGKQIIGGDANGVMTFTITY